MDPMFISPAVPMVSPREFRSDDFFEDQPHSNQHDRGPASIWSCSLCIRQKMAADFSDAWNQHTELMKHLYVRKFQPGHGGQNPTWTISPQTSAPIISKPQKDSLDRWTELALVRMPLEGWSIPDGFGAEVDVIKIIDSQTTNEERKAKLHAPHFNLQHSEQVLEVVDMEIEQDAMDLS